MTRPLSLFLVVLTLVAQALCHSYHLGGCPTIEPMQNFKITEFIGKWYVIQKTSTGSRCVYNNITRGKEPGEFNIEQVSENYLLGLAKDNKYHYTGTIYATRDNPANMTVSFPLNFVGRASYVVFSTDYSNYAGVFTCQKLAFAHRQSASILSRTPTLDKMYIDKVRSKLQSFGIDPFDLSIIDQNDCPKENDKPVEFGIDQETLTAGTLAKGVRKAGEAIGDGIEVVADKAKGVYNKYGPSHGEREEVTERGARQEMRDEWLP